jgi:hypothetical protein
MLILNALAAMFLVPAWILRFKPSFIVDAKAQSDALMETGG